MSVADALQKRVSTRGFTDKPVPKELLEDIFTRAQRSPSNCNSQPWHSYVVSGAIKDALKDKLIGELMAGKKPSPEFDWNVYYEDVLKERQYDSANTLYTAMGIERSDKQGRQMSMVRNWQFFDAPHAVFFTMPKYLGVMGAVDLGIYAQSLALLFAENGISSCFQGALGQFPEPVRETLNIPDGEGILFGMSFGYSDPEVPANKAIVGRAELEAAVSFFE